MSYKMILVPPSLPVQGAQVVPLASLLHLDTGQPALLESAVNHIVQHPQQVKYSVDTNLDRRLALSSAIWSESDMLSNCTSCGN